jgi:hypothetical protein
MAMRNLARLVIVTALLLGLGENGFAQSRYTEHTYRLDDPEARPAATLDDVAWIAGSWKGDALGGSFEEVWNPPSAGSMVGMFKLLRDGRVSFYELMLFLEDEGSLSLKVRHFDPDFTAWEDKREDLTMRFVKAEENAVHFNGISFYRISDDEMHAWLVFGSGDKLREERLVYHRVPD